MLLLQENIVYFWLIPVAFQICLPLVISGGWFATKSLGFLLKKPIPALALQS
jgi:hypothetical protein